jgi:hypothetical protein
LVEFPGLKLWKVAMSDELDALGYLQGIYRGKIIPDGQRMRAAIAALPFERPKLSVSVHGVAGFGATMERLMEARGMRPVIDGTAEQPLVAK